jgi:hypothetical protein
MSKRLAQLTKVIQNLNNRSEENSGELQDVAEQYSKEIQQILRETADKVNLFKNKLEDARDNQEIKAGGVGGVAKEREQWSESRADPFAFLCPHHQRGLWRCGCWVVCVCTAGPIPEDPRGEGEACRGDR